MRRHCSMRLAILAAALAVPTIAAAQTIGGPIGDGTNANQQSGVNAAISTGGIGSTSTAAGGAGGAGGTVTNNVTVGRGGGGGAARGAATAGPAPSRTTTLRHAPVVVAPSMQGANPCTVGISGGSSWIPFGFAFGGQWSERECRDQEWFRIMAESGNGEAGLAYVCSRYPEMRQAFADASTPCPQDRPRLAAAAPSPPPYCVRARQLEPSVADRLMREWNCP